MSCTKELRNDSWVASKWACNLYDLVKSCHKLFWGSELLSLRLKEHWVATLWMLSSTQSFLWRRPRTVSESSTYWRRIAWWQIVPCSRLDYCVLSCRQRYRWRGQRWRRKWRYKSLGRAVITFSWFPVSFLLASSPPLTHHTQMNQCHHCKFSSAD